MTTQTATTNAVTAKGQREQEARRISLEDGHPINYADSDWTFFTLADDLEDAQHNAVWRTCFLWNEFRFEGFVSDVKAG